MDIEIIVVGHLFALQSDLTGDAGGTVDGGLLMRVFSVSEFSAVAKLDGVHIRELLIDPVEIIGDRSVVCRRAGECFGCKTEFLLRGKPAGFDRFDRHRIIRRIGQNSNILVVLGCCTDHRRSADIDELDEFFEREILFRHLLERIQIDTEDVDSLDAVFHHNIVIGASAAEKTAVDFRVEGLYATVHHLGKTGVV